MRKKKDIEKELKKYQLLNKNNMGISYRDEIRTLKWVLEI